MLFLSIVIGVCVGCVCGPWLLLELSFARRVTSDAQAYPSYSTAIVLGCAPTTLKGRPNQYFMARMQACASLYEAGALKSIVVSGGVTPRVNEPEAMAQALGVLGVPRALITLDLKGNRTADSISRLKKDFGVTRAVVVSQRFHNIRSMALGWRLGMELVGLNARDPAGRMRFKMWARETVSRLRLLVDLLGPRAW